MSLNKNNISFYFLLFTISLLQAQEIVTVKTDSTTIENLDEVLVTATRTKRQLSSLPLPAQIITKKELQAINAQRLSDVVNEQTGLITVPDFGGGEGLQLQGMDSQYTLIMIDGVPLIGRSAGTLDLTRISVANIKQIEIIKGASSCLYGNEALGGVLNIITETPKDDFKSHVSYRGGSFNTHDTSIDISYKKKAFGISGFVNRYSSDGYDLNTATLVNTVEPFSNYTINTKATYDFSKRTNLTLSGRLFTQKQDNAATSNVGFLQGESSINEWNGHLKLNHKFNTKLNGYFEFYATNYKADSYLNTSANVRFSDSYFNQLMIRPEFRSSYKLNSDHTFVGGLGLTHETLDRTYFATKPEFNSPYIYLQYDANFTEKLNVIAGLRFDSHNEYKSQLSPKIALRYAFNDNIAVKGSVGYGYKAPDFRQLYFNFTNSTVGYTVLGFNTTASGIEQLQTEGQIANIVVPLNDLNGELEPESSVSFNLGADFTINSQIKFGVNLFRNNITNLIDTRVVANKVSGQNVFSYYNVNDVYTQGLETNVSYKINNNLKLSGGYQLLYAKDKAAEDRFKAGKAFASLPGQPAFALDKSDYFGLPNRSRHMANLKVFYTIPDWKTELNMRGTYRSKYGLFDTNGNEAIDSYDNFVKPYSVWDFAINKTLFDHYKVGFGIDNIFDFTDVQNITNIPGRIIYGKLNINI